MKPTDRTAAPRPGRRSRPSRSRLLRLWAIVASVYVLVAAAASAGPLKAAIAHAQTVRQPAAARLRLEPHAAGGPIPDAPDSPVELVAKAVGLEVLLLAGPPLLLLWFGWDVWFALAGFFPALGKASEHAEPPARQE